VIVVTTLWSSVRSEWLKQRRSAGLWLVVGAGFFIPALIIAVRLLRPAGLPAVYASADFWERLWTQSWESMSIFILPLVAMLCASLVTQLEYRNNTWKQVHASPQPFAAIYLSKLLMILVLVGGLLMCFNAGMFLAAIIPALVIPNVDWPAAPIPVAAFLKRNANYFVDALPIVALQYLLALRIRNFMVPLGIGMAIWILALGALVWDYNYLVPYSYAAIDYTWTVKSKVRHALPAPAFVFALGYFVVFTVAGYWIYATRSDKG
jgi:hypothetical protein